jgi:hypothetical protein
LFRINVIGKHDSQAVDVDDDHARVRSSELFHNASATIFFLSVSLSLCLFLFLSLALSLSSSLSVTLSLLSLLKSTKAGVPVNPAADVTT